MDAYDDEWQDSDFEEEENTSQAPVEYKPSYVLIAVDTDKSMFEKYQTSNGTPFQDTLDACYSIIDSIALSGQQSLKGPVGIALADSNATKTNFVEFEQPVPETIKLLRSTKQQQVDELQSNFERKGNFDLADFFLVCKNKLLNIKTEAYKRTVIYITCDDNPVGNDPKRRFKVINESQKFASINIKFVIVTFNPDFNQKHFYSEVLEASQSGPVEKVSAKNLKEKLSDLIQKKVSRRRTKFYPFIGHTDRYIDVSVRKPMVSNRVTKNMYVTCDTQEEVKKTIQQHHADSYMCTYNKEEDGLVLTEEERRILGETTTIPIGYTLLCVGTPTLHPAWVLSPPYIMEKRSTEENEVFEMFWQFCRDNGKCLVCYQKLKRGSTVQFVELTPKLINNIRHFFIRIIPFAPEIHINLTEQEAKTFNANEEKSMSKLIESLTIDYNVDTFRDPVESKKKAYIKSQLLEEKLEEIDDGVMADNVIDKLISPYIANLKNLDSVPTKKRGRDADSYKARKK